jgi:fatty acid desaturase
LQAPSIAAPASNRDFPELKRLVVEQGLLVARPSAYIGRAAWIAVGLGLCVAVLALAGGVLVQTLNGMFLAFVFTQAGFLMHDAGHHQIFRSSAHNELVGLLYANLLLGLSYSWWTDKHNRHHANPNQLDLDPDIDYPVLAFSEEQVLAKRWPWRFIVRYQAFFFFPLLLLEGLNLRFATAEHLVRGRAKRPWLEGSLLALHYAIYLGAVFSLLRTGPALAFIIANQALTGVYGGAVFAPNHKGMAVFERDSTASFLERQVLSSRNVRPGPLTDFLYGGLNYQIEHHLFPSVPRHHLPAAHGIIRRFCEERGLAYSETGVIQSYREIISYLHRVSAPLRRSGKRPASVEERGGTS